MEGFTVALALVDAVPVLSFGISMMIIAGKFQSPLFMVGAALSVLAGCCKVAWKLILGMWKKNLSWLNKPFVPMQAVGFLLMLISFVLGFGKIQWQAVLRHPASSRQTCQRSPSDGIRCPGCAPADPLPAQWYPWEPSVQR